MMRKFWVILIATYYKDRLVEVEYIRHHRRFVAEKQTFKMITLTANPLPLYHTNHALLSHRMTVK